MTYGAIETYYAGCRFRSRLEARWAVFFDALDIDWQYEPQGFEWSVDTYDEDWTMSTTTVRWLPDFYLPATGTWVEVKGSHDVLLADLKRISFIADSGTAIPGMRESCDTTRGVVILGDIPRPDIADKSKWIPIHPIIQHHKGLFANGLVFGERQDYWAGSAGRIGVVDLDGTDTYCEPFDFCGPASFDFRQRVIGCSADKALVASALKPWHPVWSAYSKARQARFEHGERGAYAR